MRKITGMILIACILLSLSACYQTKSENDIITADHSVAVSDVTEIIPTTDYPEVTESSSVDIFDNTSLWYEKIDFSKTNTSLQWSNVIVEKSESFYYATDEGLFNYNPKTKETVLLVRGYVKNVLIYEENIYYSTKDKIYMLCDDTSESYLVWNKCLPNEMKRSFCEIFDFMISDGFLYIACQINVIIRYNMKTEVAEWMFERSDYICSFNYFVLQDDYCYYIPYRSFQIHRVDYDTDEEIMVRGDSMDLLSGNKVRYDGIESANGSMYYFRRDMNAIFKYNETSEDDLIYTLTNYSEGEIDILHSMNNEELYFVYKNHGVYTVYECDNSGSSTIVLENVKLATSDNIAITESAIFWVEYIGESETKVCMQWR